MWRCDRIFLSPATAIDSCLLVSISVVQIETTFSTAHLHQSALVQVLHNLLDGVDYFTCTNILASCPRSVGAERLHSTRRREGGGGTRRKAHATVNSWPRYGCARECQVLTLTLVLHVTVFANFNDVEKITILVLRDRAPKPPTNYCRVCWICY